MTIRCPRCGHTAKVAAPTDQCVLVHDCANCGAQLRREPGACCVFCSHTDDPAPQPPAPGPITRAGCRC
ncbi:MAG: GDCCVxC domain-containing (seleno)protein [Pseudomonadota bacterium]